MEGCQADGDGAGIFVYKGNLQSNATAAWPEQLVQIGFTVLVPEKLPHPRTCSSKTALAALTEACMLSPAPESWSPALEVRVT